MPRIIHTKGKKGDKYIPKYNRKIAKGYIGQAINLVDQFNVLERNKRYVEKIVDNGISDGIIIFADHRKFDRLEKQQTAMSEYLTPEIIHGKKVWNKGRGLNPFLALYMHRNKNWVVNKPSPTVMRLMKV